MKFKEYLLNEGLPSEFFSSIKRLSVEKAKKFFREKWLEFSKIIKEKGVEDQFLSVVNRHLKTNFRSLEQIDKQKINEEILQEDFQHFWSFFKENTFPSLSFYPALSIWMEVDKIFGDTSPDLKKIAIYGIFFIMIIGTAHIKKWYNWKKDNPEEFEKEGQPGPFSYKK